MFSSSTDDWATPQDFYDNVTHILQKKITDCRKTGAEIPCFVILHMEE
jgi:hypothetical protein